jgi:hypothetical protein
MTFNPVVDAALRTESASEGVATATDRHYELWRLPGPSLYVAACGGKSCWPDWEGHCEAEGDIINTEARVKSYYRARGDFQTAPDSTRNKD